MSDLQSPLGDIVVRPLSSSDVPKVRELHSMVLPVHYPSSFFLQLLLLPGRICLVAHHRSDLNHPIAFISASVREMRCNNSLKVSALMAETPQTEPGGAQSHIEILTLGVLPAYQNRGLARHLLHCVHRHFRDSNNFERHSKKGTRFHANVAASNMSALTFYERVGMQISSEVIRNLYRTCSYGSRDGYLVVGYLY